MDLDQGADVPGEPTTAGPEQEVLRNAQDFSLVLGGPLFQLLRRARLADDAAGTLRKRVLILALVPWLPLLVLSALEGNLLGTRVAVPFLLDVDIHARFLVVVPLLVIAELLVHLRIRPIVQGFLDRNLIPEAALPRYGAAIKSAFRLRNSAVAEGLLVAFVYGFGVLFLWRHVYALDTATWYATPSDGGLKHTLAGTWYAYVSIPVFQFLLIRWYYRLVVWARFLWQVSRIPLNLVPTHPDRLGGLGFVTNSASAMAVIAVAHGAIIAGNLANRIFFMGGRLPDFKAEIAFWVVLVQCLAFAPLLAFAPQLARAKRQGNREYGTLAMRYVREFDAKWLRGGAPSDEPFVGTGDIQSLADLANSFEVVRGMRIAPVTRDAVLQLVGAVLAPVVPLALTMMPLEDLLKQLFSILL